MPMTGSLSNRISEFHGGKTYARTKAKHGAKTANRQAVAAAYASMGKTRTIGEMHREAKKKK